MAVSADIRAAATAVTPDGSVVQVEPLTGGSSAFVARLVLASPGGSQHSVVFRQHTDRAEKVRTGVLAAKEFDLTAALHALGFEVARPLALHGEQASDGPWLVMEWIEGSTAVDAADADMALSQMARFLARLHALDLTTVSAPGLLPIEDPVEELPGYLRDDELGHALARVLDLGVVRQPNADVLLHGDFWPGNVLFDRNELVAVLDWEDASYGDPLADLACARVELTCAHGDEASDRFTAEYLEARPDHTARLLTHDLALWDVYVSVTALAAMHRWGLSPEEEGDRRERTTRFVRSAIEQLAGKR